MIIIAGEKMTELRTHYTGICCSSRKIWLQFLFFPSVNMSVLSWDKPTAYSLRSLSGSAQGSSKRILSWNIPPLVPVKHSGIEKSLYGIMGNETWDAVSVSFSVIADWSGWKQWLVSTYAHHAEQSQREPEGQAARDRRGGFVTLVSQWFDGFWSGIPNGAAIMICP